MREEKKVMILFSNKNFVLETTNNVFKLYDDPTAHIYTISAHSKQVPTYRWVF